MTPLERVESLMKTTSLRAAGGAVGPMTLEGNERSNDQIDKRPLQLTMQTVFGSKTRREIKFSALDESAKKAAPKLFL
jgi:hypothetical protein